jgi:hypothetical protein
MDEVMGKPDGTYHYPGGIQVIKATGRIDVTDEDARARLIHAGELYEIITANLFAENITSADERMECARTISDLIEERLKARLK